MPTTPRRRLTARQAQAVADHAELVKAPDWSTTHDWHVVDQEGAVLVVITPSYGGVSRSGRNGWKYYLAALGPSGSSDKQPTTQAAAAQGLAAWIRWSTAAR
jgi:hypothetical protein